SDVRTAFRPVGVLRRKALMHARHGFGLTRVTVPSHSVDKLKDLGVAHHVLGTSPEIVVVIQKPDLRVEIGAAQSRAEKLLDKARLILLAPQSGWHFSVLISVNFVLSRHCADIDAFCAIALEETHKVLRVCRKVLLAH